MNTTEHALDTLRRAAEHGYPWSIYPAEATALVAEVERLRAEVSLLKEEAHIRRNINAGLIAEMDRLRAELKAERADAVAWLEKAGWMPSMVEVFRRGEHRKEDR